MQASKAAGLGSGLILEQLANAAWQGGIGSIPGQILSRTRHRRPSNRGRAPPAGQGASAPSLVKFLAAAAIRHQPGSLDQGGSGGSGGLLGSLIFGKLASGQPGEGPAEGSAAAGRTSQMPGFDPASIQVSLEGPHQNAAARNAAFRRAAAKRD